MENKLSQYFNYFAAAFLGLMTFILIGCPAVKASVPAGFWSYSVKINCVKIVEQTGGLVAGGIFDILALVLGIALFAVGIMGILAALGIAQGKLDSVKKLDKAITGGIALHFFLTFLALISVASYVIQTNKDLVSEGLPKTMSVGGGLISLFVFALITLLAVCIAYLLSKKANLPKHAAASGANDIVKEETVQAPAAKNEDVHDSDDDKKAASRNPAQKNTKAAAETKEKNNAEKGSGEASEKNEKQSEVNGKKSEKPAEIQKTEKKTVKVETKVKSKE